MLIERIARTVYVWCLCTACAVVLLHALPIAADNGTAPTEPFDSTAPIDIYADTLTANQNDNRITYQGNVHVHQHQLKLWSDTLIAEQTSSQISVLHATGTQVILHYADVDTQVRTTATDIYYDRVGEVITIQGAPADVYYWDKRQGAQRIQGNRLRYDMATKRLDAQGKQGNARGENDNDTRVKVRITP